MTAFGTDQVLLYDVEPWNRLGFGVPNFGDNQTTLNFALFNLTDEIGRCQLFIMQHADATRRDPPSRNTVERIGKMSNRLKSVLLNRKVDYNQNRLEEGHGSPEVHFWKIHPVPYYGDAYIQNHWLKEYNSLTMLLLTNAFQNTNNSLAIEFTPELCGDLWSFGARIQSLLGVELLGLDKAVVETDEFRFDSTHYDGYNPTEFTVRTEAISRPVSNYSRFTEDDLAPLERGIPANLIAPFLSRYPSFPTGEAIETPRSNPVDDDETNPGTNDQSAISPII